VSGTVGNEITYIADVTGALTDGIGGVVRITGSDNDQTQTRTTCITLTNKDYRVFRGFQLDSAATIINNASSSSHNTYEDLVILQGTSYCRVGINNTSTNVTMRRCLVFGSGTAGGNVIEFASAGSGDQSDTAHVVENCIIVGAANTTGIRTTDIGGLTIRHCLIVGATNGVVSVSLAAGQTTTVQNCVIASCGTALSSDSTATFSEDYNSISSVNTARSNVTEGANSNTYPPLLAISPLLSGFRFPWQFGALSEWSQIRALAGTAMAADDFLGMTRPATDSKKSWGAIQYQDVSRDAVTYRGASGASLKLADAGRHQMFVPVTAASTTIGVYVYRGADYAGDLPQIIIKQPGQADRTVTDTGSVSTWNLLTDTFTPAASPPYVIVDLVSRNTATSGSYATHFDDLGTS
jgi:hypothetical protein